MRITSLVENTTKSELKTKHGLSLYIETKSHKILFDLGSDSTLFENAMKRNIDISKVDTVIISHGHFDSIVELISSRSLGTRKDVSVILSYGSKRTRPSLDNRKRMNFGCPIALMVDLKI